jgi:hypothetical protein
MIEYIFGGIIGIIGMGIASDIYNYHMGKKQYGSDKSKADGKSFENNAGKKDLSSRL